VRQVAADADPDPRSRTERLRRLIERDLLPAATAIQRDRRSAFGKSVAKGLTTTVFTSVGLAVSATASGVPALYGALAGPAVGLIHLGIDLKSEQNKAPRNAAYFLWSTDHYPMI
jgi:hypothetical protein